MMRRQKVRSACEECHQRKAKCIIPEAGGSCQACLSYERHCYFLPRKKCGRPARVYPQLYPMTPLSNVWSDNNVTAERSQGDVLDMMGPNHSEAFPYVDASGLENSVGYTPSLSVYDDTTDYTRALPQGNTNSFDINDMLSVTDNLSQAVTNIPTTTISDTYSGSTNDQFDFNINRPIANTEGVYHVPTRATAEAFEQYGSTLNGNLLECSDPLSRDIVGLTQVYMTIQRLSYTLGAPKSYTTESFLLLHPTYETLNLTCRALYTTSERFSQLRRSTDDGEGIMEGTIIAKLITCKVCDVITQALQHHTPRNQQNFEQLQLNVTQIKVSLMHIQSTEDHFHSDSFAITRKMEQIETQMAAISIHMGGEYPIGGNQG